MKAVDLFSGLGGNTIAASSVGIEIVYSANHSQKAVDYYYRNNKTLPKPICQDLQQAKWEDVPAHDLLIASPCCQGHTKARGKNGPNHYNSRSTAFAVVSCAEFHLPEFIFIENVTEFLNWSFFPEWKACLEKLGYALSVNILDAADFGIPQNRVRMYIIGTRTHSPFCLKPRKKKPVPVSSILDLNLNNGRWSDVNKPARAPATLRRVANGRKTFGHNFVMPYYGSGSGLTGRSLDRPVGTITTKDRWAVVIGDKMRMFTADEYRKAMSFPAETLLPDKKEDAVLLLGNATCPKKISHLLKYLQAA